MKNLLNFAGAILLCAAFAYAKDPPKPENTLYNKECASCHFAYQPWLLPSSSWRWMMNSLETHYGTDASLDEEEIAEITQYLLENAAEKATNHQGIKFALSMKKGSLYTSISQVPAHKKAHKKVKSWMIEQKEVGDIARCAACHTKAQEGIYGGQNTINIPNYGIWRD